MFFVLKNSKLKLARLYLLSISCSYYKKHPPKRGACADSTVGRCMKARQAAFLLSSPVPT